ncbi:MAG TPA: hypothetical protein VFV52_10285 [Bacilli bacterium]|nr:hypothetical protein [Bacilli bacterium]
MELTAGIMLVLLSILHVAYGEKMQVPLLKQATDDSILLGAYRVMSLQGGLLLFAVGLINILNATSVITLQGIAVYFPLGIILLNILGFMVIAFSRHRELFKITVPQFLLFLIVVTLESLALV